MGIRGADMWYVLGRININTGFWCGNLDDRDHTGDLGVDE